MQGGDINLYENMRCHGVPLVTISRGRVVYENGVFMCAEGTGKFCPLRSFPDSVYKKLVQREKVRGQGGAAGTGRGCRVCAAPVPRRVPAWSIAQRDGEGDGWQQPWGVSADGGGTLQVGVWSRTPPSSCSCLGDAHVPAGMRVWGQSPPVTLTRA